MSTDSPAQDANANPGFSSLLHEIVPVLAFLRRWWWLAVLMTILTSMTTLIMVIIRGADYQVSAALFYKLGAELAPPPTMGKDPLVITRRSEDVNDEIEILTSPDLLRKVIQELGEPFFTPPPSNSAWARFKNRLRAPVEYVMDNIEEILIQTGLRNRLTKLEKIELALAGRLKVELVRESDIIAITLDTPAPESGVIVLDKLIEAYQSRHLEIHQELAVKDFLSRQTDQLRDQLAASTERLLSFQQTHDLWSPGDQQKMLLDNRKSLQLQTASSTAKVAALTETVNSLKSLVSNMPERIELSDTVQLNPAIEDMQDRLASMSMNRAVIETAYRATSREVIDRSRQIEDLQTRISQMPELVPYAKSTGVNLPRQELAKEQSLRQAELAGLKQQLDVEQLQLADVNKSLQVLGESIARFQHLEREHRILEHRYSIYNENFEKADISAVMNLSQISNMELITPPVASLQPVRPRLSMVAAAAILSGLALAFALAVTYDLRAALRARRPVS